MPLISGLRRIKSWLTHHALPIEIARDSEQLRSSRHWAKQFQKMRADPGYWCNNKIVGAHICNLISGTVHHWLPWALNEHFASAPQFDRVLSVCCGDGNHELMAYKSGKVGFIHGFDLSAGAIAQAKARFEQAGVPSDRYRFDVLDANRLELNERYDLAISAGALHHVTELEQLAAMLRQVLQPNGRLVMVEFVGANRFQWTDEQIELINGLLGTLDPYFLHNQARATFGRPTVEEMMRIDPSEAVRSRDILPVLREHFEFEVERPYNGTIIHQLYPLLNNALANQDRPDFDSIVRLILYVEDLLIKKGVLPTDFVFLIGRPK